MSTTPPALDALAGEPPEPEPASKPKRAPRPKGWFLLRGIALALALVVAAPIALSSQHIFQWAKDPAGLSLDPAFAVAAFVALDLAAVVCVGMTVYSSMKGETGGVFMILTWLFAGGSALINYQAAVPTPSDLDGPFFAAMSIAGPVLLEAVLHRLRKWYRQAEGTRAGAAAQFGVRWVVAPVETGRAWMASRRENIARPEEAIAYVREVAALDSMDAVDRIRYAWAALGTHDEYAVRTWLQARGQVVTAAELDLAMKDRPRSPLVATQVPPVEQLAGERPDPDPDPGPGRGRALDSAPEVIRPALDAPSLAPVPSAEVAALNTLRALPTKRDQIRQAFATLGEYDVPGAVKWLAERGITVSRTDAYAVRKEDQERNRTDTLRAVQTGS